MRLAEIHTSPPRAGGSLKRLGILLLIFISIIGLYIYQTISPGQAALLIESDPQAVVSINGRQKGKTPFETEMGAGEVFVTIAIENPTVPLPPYEARIKLAKGVKTIVRHNFGEREGEAFGQVFSFEEHSMSEASVSIISVPDGVNVELDGEYRGVTPLKITTTPGNHGVKLFGAGYKTNDFEVNSIDGYALTVIAQLAKQNKLAEAQETVLSSEDQPLNIEILETPNGFLRVRAEASIDSEEIGRVETGKTYEVLEESQNNDWFKIKIDEKEGWVSAQFAKLSK